MSLANTHAAVVEHLIIFADRFFPGEVSGFNICFCRGTATSKFVFFFSRSIFMRPTLSPCTLVYFNHLRLWTGDLSIEVNCFFCRVSKLKPCLNLGGFSCRRTCRNFQRREADAPTHGKHRRVSWASPSGHARQLCIRQVRVTKLAQTVSFFSMCVTINLFVAQRKLKVRDRFPGGKINLLRNRLARVILLLLLPWKHHRMLGRQTRKRKRA